MANINKNAIQGCNYVCTAYIMLLIIIFMPASLVVVVSKLSHYAFINYAFVLQ